jgi:3-hydroxyisobutyrate dehydrogenase-like beta-hydroxyacid dehydrogenase
MTNSKMDVERYDVAVIGCGAMGSAIARLLRRNGHTVAAWNRTHARSEALAPDGIVALASATEAAASAPLVIACQSTYASTWSSLAEVDDWAGATFVNLALGTAADAERMREWTEGLGGRYLDGVINCYPGELGEPDAATDIAGDREAWTTHEAILCELGGGTELVSESVVAPNVSQLGAIAFYIPALCAYVESAAYLNDKGFPPDVARRHALTAIDLLRNHTEEIYTAIRTEDHADDEAALDTYADAMRLIREELRATGLRAPMVEAATATLETARQAGLAELGISAQSLLLREQET